MKSIFVVFLVLCILCSYKTISRASYLSVPNTCNNETKSWVFSLYPDKAICSEVVASSKLEMMPQTSIFTCLNQSTGVMMKFWLIEVDDCYLIRGDQYDTGVVLPSTEYKFSYSSLSLVFVFLLGLLGVYLKYKRMITI